MRVRTEPLLLAVATVLAVLGATSSLGAVVMGGHWVLWATFTAALVVGTSAAARLPRVPSFVVPLSLPLVLLALVTATTTSGTALLGVIPTPTSIGALGTAAQAGLDQTRTYAAPVDFTPEIRLLVLVAVFVVAALVDLLVVLARRPALAGLPLLVLWAVPSFTAKHGVGTWPLVLVASSFLLLLAAERRAHAAPVGRGATTPLLGRVGVTVAGVSVLATLAAAALTPGVGNGVLGGRFRGDGDGTGSVTVIAPLVTVASRLHDSAVTELFTVQTDTPEYLRMTALDTFSNGRFTLDAETTPSDAQVSKSVPAAPGPGSTPTMPVFETISIGPLAESYLPLPYSPTRIQVSNKWVLGSRTRTVFSTSATTENLDYKVTSAVPVPSAALLRSDGNTYDAAKAGSSAPDLVEDLKVDNASRAAVAQQLATITAGTTTMYDKALAMVEYFQGPDFHYDLNATVEPGALGLADFLKDGNGYCEQFATAMTVMARAAGIPARVAVGFTPGTLQADGRWHVTTEDAHAWPELWFDSAGWVRFEPTPRGDTSTFDPSYTANVRPDQQANPSASSIPSPTASVAPTDIGKTKDDSQPSVSAAPVLAAPGSSTRGFSPFRGLPLVVLLTLVGLVLLALLSLTPSFLAARVRHGRLFEEGASATGASTALLGRTRRSPASAPALAHRAWSELMADVRDAGLRVPPGRSPRTIGASLADLLGPDWPDAAAAVVRLTRAEERARYARPDQPGAGSSAQAVLAGSAVPGGSGPPEGSRVTSTPVVTSQSAATDLALVRHALLGRSPFLLRVRMRLFPSSLVPVGAGLYLRTWFERLPVPSRLRRSS